MFLDYALFSINHFQLRGHKYVIWFSFQIFLVPHASSFLLYKCLCFKCISDDWSNKCPVYFYFYFVTNYLTSQYFIITIAYALPYCLLVFCRELLLSCTLYYLLYYQDIWIYLLLQMNHPLCIGHVYFFVCLKLKYCVFSLLLFTSRPIQAF